MASCLQGCVQIQDKHKQQNQYVFFVEKMKPIVWGFIIGACYY